MTNNSVKSAVRTLRILEYFESAVGSVSLGFALFNVVGGFLVTDRMLAMFSRKSTRK